MRKLGGIGTGLLGIALAGIPAGGVAPALAQQTQPAGETESDEAKQEDLDQRIKVLERLRELDEEKAAEKAKEGATVSVGKDGFSVQSSGGNFALRLKALLQFDGAFFQGDEAKTETNSFQLTSARPMVEATVSRIYDLKFVPDFGQGKTVIQDATLDARFHPLAMLRVGKFKSPFGLERLQSEGDLMFVARALPTNLVPNRDLGIMVYGEAMDGVLAYQGGVFNGVPDGGSGDVDTDDGKDQEARIFAHPFRKTSISGLKGLGFGVAATLGISQGKPSSPGLPAYKTPGNLTFFTYLAPSSPTAANTVVADGRRERISPQLYYYFDRFGLMGEWVRTSQAVQIGAAEETIDNTSWQVSATCFLTRDRATYKRVVPRKDLEPSGGAGAVEIGLRVASLKVDPAAFPIFADPAVSAREATQRTAGVNWYLNRNIKTMLNYAWTAFKGGASAGGDRPDEKVIEARFQFVF